MSWRVHTCGHKALGLAGEPMAGRDGAWGLAGSPTLPAPTRSSGEFENRNLNVLVMQVYLSSWEGRTHLWLDCDFQH